MFKKLFGSKKNKPESLDIAKSFLLENIKEPALYKDIPKSLEACIEFLEESIVEDIEDLKNSVFALTQSQSVGEVSQAFSVYANLLERLEITDKDIEQAINLYATHLNNAIPFFNVLSSEIKKGEEDEGYYAVDIEELYQQLIKDRNQISEDIAKSTVLIDALVQNLVNILSIDPSYIKIAKKQLHDNLKQIKDYNQGGFWLDKLFQVLFNDPIIVIDVDNHVGFEGRMSGVSDAYQMHLLLMGLTELNEVPPISPQELAVANGTSIHTTNVIVGYKWNMYNYGIVDQENWDEIKIGPAKTLELQDFWIPADSTPPEISVHNGRRVILLGRSPIKRTSKLQRTFKNLKANIEVERMLSEEEINEWLRFN